MNKIKKLFKYLLFLVIGITILLSVLAYVMSEPRPEGNRNREADILATKMIDALGQQSFDSTNILQWSFAGKNHYIWDKQRNLAQITWGENKVILNLDDHSIAKVYNNDELISGDENKISL